MAMAVEVQYPGGIGGRVLAHAVLITLGLASMSAAGHGLTTLR